VARLPVPGSDENTWGDVLNDFLTQSLNTDGTIKPAAAAAAVPDASSSQSGTVQLTNDLGGTSSAPVVTGLQNHAVSSTAPTDGQFLVYNAGATQWQPQTSAGGYTDEMAQDAVGGTLTDTATVNLTYTDATPAITADVIDDSITYAKIQNVSATDRLLGRDTAAAGNIEELTVSGGLEFTGSGGIQRSALTGGDVTATAGSAVATIANDAVTFAKMQNISTARVLGRTTGGSGDVEELSAGTGISIAGGQISSTVTAYTDEQAQDAVGTILNDSSTVDFTYDDATPTITASVIDDSITFAKLQNISTARLLGRSTASAGNVEELTIGTGLQLTGGALSSTVTQYTDENAQDAVGTILTDTATVNLTYNDTTPAVTADVIDGSITYAKLQDVSATDRVLGRSTAGAGDVEEITFTSQARQLADDTSFSAMRTTLGLEIGTNVQGADATLSALAAYNTNGLLTQTAADTFTGRTITGTSNRITVTNGNGVSGNPTLDIGTDVLTLTGTQALTNKTLTDSTNNVTANGLRSATTTVGVSAATAPSAGQVLRATSGTAATWQDLSATNVSFTAGGTIAATDAQTAIAEVATDAAAALASHAADATIHSSGRELAHASVTSNQGSITSTGTAVTDLTSLTFSVTTTSRPAYLIGVLHVTHATAGAGVTVCIMPSAATTTAGAIQIATVTVPTASRQAEIHLQARIPPSTSDTYRLAAQVTAGTGTLVASATQPSIFKAVEA
jgi:hypothetical protein